MSLCNGFLGEVSSNVTVWLNASNSSNGYNTAHNATDIPDHTHTYKYIMTWFVYPAICAFGLLGNLLALMVLLCRIREGVEMLEKSCLVGMIGK